MKKNKQSLVLALFENWQYHLKKLFFVSLEMLLSIFSVALVFSIMSTDEILDPAGSRKLFLIFPLLVPSVFVCHFTAKKLFPKEYKRFKWEYVLNGFCSYVEYPFF